jgi:uncharacterized membrane protein
LKNKKTVWIIFTIILLLGIFLRFYGLTGESFDFDEIHTTNTLHQPDLKSAVSIIIVEEDIPGINFIFLRGLYLMVGDDPFWLRTLPVLFSILTIVFLFLLAKKLFDNKVALISSLLLAISMVNISHAQTIRSYSFFTFITVISFYLFVYLKEKPKIYPFYIVSIILSCYTHYFAIFTIIIHNFLMLMWENKISSVNKRWWLSQGIIALFVWPLLLLIPIQLGGYHATLQFILMHKLGLPQFIAQFGLYFFILPIILLALAGLVIFLFRKKLFSLYKKISFCPSLFFVFITLSLFVYIKIFPLLLAPSYLTRYTLFVLPFAFIFVAWGISKLKPKTLQFLVIIAILIVGSFSLHAYYTETSKEQWREAGEFVSQQAKNNEIILFQGIVQRPFNYYYNYFQKDLALKGQIKQIKLEEGNDTSKKQFFTNIKDDLDSSTGIWFIESHSYEDNRELYLNLLHKSYNLKFIKKFKGIDVYYFEK